MNWAFMSDNYVFTCRIEVVGPFTWENSVLFLGSNPQPGIDNRLNLTFFSKVTIWKALHPVDLFLISEKSIWKNQVWWTGFFVYFKLDFYCLCSLQKSISSNLIFPTWIFKIQVQINREYDKKKCKFLPRLKLECWNFFWETPKL